MRATRPRKPLEEFTRELRERQAAHRAKLLARQDAKSVYARNPSPRQRELRAAARKRYLASQRAIRHADHRAALAAEVAAAERRERELAAIKRAADGELAELLAAQERDRLFGDRIPRRPWLVSLDVVTHGLSMHERVAA